MLRPLATTSRTRVEPLPNVPTIAESGYGDYEMEVRLWLFAPAKTPKEKVAEIAHMFTAAMQEPDVKSKLVAQDLYPVAMCGADFAAFVQKRYGEVGRVIHRRSDQVRRLLLGSRNCPLPHTFRRTSPLTGEVMPIPWLTELRARGLCPAA